MVGPSVRARWGGLLAILVLSIISGGWLLRRKAAPDGSVVAVGGADLHDLGPQGGDVDDVASNPKDAAPGTIRAEFARSVGENSVHGSDAPETAREEIAYWFSGTEIVG